MVPTSAAIVDELKSGRRAVREALEQPWVWLVDQGHDGSHLEAWSGRPDGLPQKALPEPGTMLYAHLEPLLRVRMIGDDLKRGAIPGSVVQRAVDSVQKTLRGLIGLIDEASSQVGRPAESLRRLYDLPAVSLSYGSFAISFGAPPLPVQVDLANAKAGEDARNIERLRVLLSKGLAWAYKAGVGAPIDALDDEMARIVAAIEPLAPPLTGQVCEVEVGGRLSTVGVGSSTRRVLTRATKKAMKTALKARPMLSERIAEAVGAIDEMDKG